MVKKRREQPEESGTINVSSVKQMEEILKEYDNQMISPGGAAAFLGVSRAYVYQLEKEGKIRAYRVPEEAVEWYSVPNWARLILPKRTAYIYIPIVDLQKVKDEMIAKAEARLKKLKAE